MHAYVASSVPGHGHGIRKARLDGVETAVERDRRRWITVARSPGRRTRRRPGRWRSLEVLRIARQNGEAADLGAVGAGEADICPFPIEGVALLDPAIGLGDRRGQHSAVGGAPRSRIAASALSDTDTAI